MKFTGTKGAIDLDGGKTVEVKEWTLNVKQSWMSRLIELIATFFKRMFSWSSSATT